MCLVNCVDQQSKRSPRLVVTCNQDGLGWKCALLAHVYCLHAVQSTIPDCHSEEKCTWWNALAHVKEELCHRLEAKMQTCAVYITLATQADLPAQSVYSRWQSYSIIH